MHFLINDPFAIYSYVYIAISLDIIISNLPLLILRSVESRALRVPTWPFHLASASSGDAGGSLRIGFWTRLSFLVPADGAPCSAVFSLKKGELSLAHIVQLPSSSP